MDSILKNNILKKDTNLVFPHIFRLSASAGSGKTHSLVLRYVQFLLSSCVKKPTGDADGTDISTNALNNITAITFTNKAANEMKERILQLLKKVAIGEKEESEQIKSIIDTAEESDESLSLRASVLVDNIIKNYTDFNVKTIDSFLAEIIRASLIEIDINPGFEIITDKLSYIDFSIGKLLFEAKEDDRIRKIFLNFVKNYVLIENKTLFNPRRTINEVVGKLRDIEYSVGKYFDIAEYADEDFIEKSHGGIDRLADKIVKKPAALFSGNISECGGLLGDLAGEISRLQNVRFKKIFEKGLTKILKKDFSSSFWKNSDVKNILAGVGAADGDKWKAIGELQLIWDDIRGTVKDIILSTGSIKFYPYMEILKESKRIMGEKLKSDGVVLLDELKIKVNELIKGNMVPDIYFNIGEQVYHYLIDEFQDTDRLQWDNLRGLIENSLSNGGSLFYVGDKKQSIYRFKGGYADLFDDVTDEFSRNNVICEDNLYREKLRYNFRSKKILVDFFNKTFNPKNLIEKLLFSENMKSKPNRLEGAYRNKVGSLIYGVYENHEQFIVMEGESKSKEDFKGYIRIERLSDDHNNDKDGNNIKNGDYDAGSIGPSLSKTVDIIKGLAGAGRRYTFRDIAILTRTNSDAAGFVLKLKEEGVPVKSNQSADIRYNRLIMEIISFLKFIDDPADNLSFINFISGKIFSTAVKYDDFTLRKGINDFILKNTGKEFIYIKFKEWGMESVTAAGLWDGYISELFNGVGFYSVYETVCRLYEKFDIYKNFTEHVGFFMHLLEIIKNREDAGENDLDLFIDFFEDTAQDAEQFLTEPDPSNNAINVLTAHKAKGLQFPVVIVPYACIKKKPINRILISSCPSLYDDCDKISLYYTNKNEQELLFGVDENLPETKGYILEKSMSFLDELNLFYVSLTRAKEELYIMTPSKIGKSRNELTDLFFEDERSTDRDEENGDNNILELGEKRF